MSIWTDIEGWYTILMNEVQWIFCVIVNITMSQFSKICLSRRNVFKVVFTEGVNINKYLPWEYIYIHTHS